MEETIASIHPAGVVWVVRRPRCCCGRRKRPQSAVCCCGCYSWGGKYMSDLITHTQDLGRSVGRSAGVAGDGRDGGKPRSIPSVVVVVRRCRPNSEGANHRPEGQGALQRGFSGLLSMRIAQTPRERGHCAGALIGWPRTGRGKRLQRASEPWSLACFFAFASGRARCETHPPLPMKPLSSCATR